MGRSKGFSLTEMMVVLAIMGIAMSIGVPAVRDLMANQRMRGAAFNLVVSTMFARGEAIKRGTTVAIKAPSSDDLTTGWCIQIGSTETCDVSDPGVSAIKVEQPQTGVTYEFKTAAAPISFNRAGRLAALVKVEITDSVNAAMKRCVVIDVGGNATSTVGACS